MEDPRARAPQLMRTRMYGCWPRNIIAVIRWNWDSSALTRVLEASTWQLRFEPRLFIFRTFHPREFVPFLRYQARVIRNRIGSDPILCFRVKRYKYSLFIASFSSFFIFLGDPVNSRMWHFSVHEFGIANCGSSVRGSFYYVLRKSEWVRSIQVLYNHV